jgi:hypothetical protein
MKEEARERAVKMKVIVIKSDDRSILLTYHSSVNKKKIEIERH